MKVPLSWLSDYVDISNIDTKTFAHELTMSGSKVEGIEVQGEEIVNVVTGKILTREKHLNADKLQVTTVDIGNEVIQIVTGAQNIEVGDIIPIALVGSKLPGGKSISKGKLRGIESNGMMCSIQELNLTKGDYPDASEDGIFILNEGTDLGKDIREVLGINEKIVEFEITSNRPDCLSMLGIARETAVTFKKPMKKPIIKVEEKDDEVEKYASVEVLDAKLCPRYSARVIKNVKIAPSPKWMRDRLKASGVRPINNIVDITNYVMLELGQPMHAFDLKNLKGSKIIVRRAMNGEVLKTLDDNDRVLDESMLVIADEAEPIAVAGVMGGANSEISQDTSTILLESANFDGASVRLTSKKLGMRTEASGRFEKGLDIENVIAAVNRAAELVEELEAGTVCKGVIDCYKVKAEKRNIKLRSEKINALLGTNISNEEMIKIFRKLELIVDEDNMIVEIPSFRADIELEADLAEEVARIHGYNTIEATLLSGKATTQGKKTFKQKIEDTIKNTMIACGLSEIYTYSFTSPNVFDMINLPADSLLRNTVNITNPLGEDYSVMRTTTIPAMLDVISRNYNRRTLSAKLFEISNIYLPKSIPVIDLPVEKLTLTLGMYGESDFYDLKGVIDELFGVLGIKEYEYIPERTRSEFHPGRTASISLKGCNIGVIGEIHPEVSEKFEGPQRTYVAIIDVDSLVNNACMVSQYKPLPKYPAVTRDIAMLVKDEIMVKQIEDIIRQRSGKILEEIKLFDVYKGKQVPEGMKSVAYSVVFRGEDRTLTDDDVNKAMRKVLDGLESSLNAQLRE